MTDLKTELGESIALNVETSSPAQRRSLSGSIRSMPPWVGAIIGIVVIIIIWELVAVLFFETPTGKAGSVPPPLDVFIKLVQDLTDSVFWNAIGATGLAGLKGYVIGNVIAFFLAFLVLLLPWFDGLATQLAVVASCIPITAVGPIVALLSMAGSRSTSVFLAALSVIFTTVVGTLLGLRAASATQLDVISAYGGSRFTQLVKVRLIAAVPSILAALKLGAPAAFLGAVLGEYFLVGVDSGLGILLLAAQATASSVKLWALALICAGVAGLAYFVIGRIGRLVTPWSAGESTEGGF